MKVLWIFLLAFLGRSIGRPIEDVAFPLQQKFDRKLLQFVRNCTKGSDQILTEYPSVVSLRNLLDQDQPNTNVLCGGVLLSTDTILTSTGCIWQEVENGVPFNLAMNNPVNRNIDRDFLVAISPYCTHGDGAELGEILGYHFMEEDYTGYPKDGNSVAVLEMKENVTSITNSELPALRTIPLPVGSILTMVGHGATNNQEASLANQNYSRPYKEINYTKISDQECSTLLNNLQSDKVLDGVTETCALVEEVGGVNICNTDDGNPLYDLEGNIAGIITINQCERTGDKSMPIVFADVSKQKVQQFIKQTETESLFIPPNITEGCNDNQTLQAAPWSVAIQFPRTNDQEAYYNVCGGVLIDNSTKVVTAAQCLWDQFFSKTISVLQNSINQTTGSFDLREPKNPLNGNFQLPIFASLAPRCRHFNGVYPRNKLNNYWIHPKYNGNPKDGYNIAILGLKQQFPPDQSFPNFEVFLKTISPGSNFSNVMFYGWGAETVAEAQKDLKGFFNNYFPAKQVSMELISKEKCAVFLEQKIQYPYDRESELCADQTLGENFTNICIYDKGGPLVGRLNETNQLVLLGLKSQFQDRNCIDTTGSYEVFTDVFEMKDFIISILDPTLSFARQNRNYQIRGTTSNTVLFIIILASFLFILITSLQSWRCISRNNKTYQAQIEQLQSRGQSNFQGQQLELNEDVKNIHLMLGKIATKCKSPKTGKSRRSSDLAASLNFVLSQEKIQTQFLVYTMFSVDDLLLGAQRGATPPSPLLLAAMQKYQAAPTTENTIQSVQLRQNSYQNERIQNRIQMFMDINFGNELKGFQNQTVNQGLIFADTPARKDFDMTIEFNKDLQIGDRLGTGAFGSVYKAVWLTRNIEVAVKIIHTHVLDRLIDDQKQGGNLFNSITSELFLLGRIDSKHVVKCYGGSLKPPNVCLVLEYLSKGSLDRFIYEYFGEIPIGFIMRVAQGIAQGLAALHPTIVHRDLKPQNVLLDDSYHVKLADFGMSKMKEDTHLSETLGVKGTPAYIAPEALKEESVDEKCNIYALGLIIWEMVAKKRPWQDLSYPVIMARVAIKGERPPIPHTCPDELKRLIERCWATNPKERPSAREVVQRLTILRRGPTKKSDLSAFQNNFCSFQGKTQEQSTSNLVSSQQFSFNFSQFTIKSFSSTIQNENM